MEISKTQNGTELTISLSGRLDTTTAPVFEEDIKNSLANVAKLVLDFKELEYVSSAGLRVILFAQKAMNKQGKMLIKNVCSDIMEVFEITGFTDILSFE